MPLAFITPLTPSGMRYAQAATLTGSVACKTSLLSDWSASSEVSATNTRPSSFIVSTRAGTTFYRRFKSVTSGTNERATYNKTNTYQETRATYQSHEVVALCYSGRILNRHRSSSAAVNVRKCFDITS
ncbi:uncharacterized protein BP01DRAFT_158457 [Aspergillus saccharolyticus JOP 1030-1]|uniref:Uncharacterized protein n=1 Tax=Aspergillus saccharolyticus JOP 1030-1 TaxID=1450539 RepID=A0A318Z3Z8_9EURO|nr:hypothetical protein BP01DRAFT_158457 [Aspergillus saccharolyticus JOP 1030-1]PYH41806.1 hypothetical protein BP01DRAFT_158457 [Aspergillus saccharolyticus JOP 1030-1]